MLAVGVLAQGASAVFVNGAAFLLPELHRHQHLSLTVAGVVVAMPTMGITLTLIAWGAVTDRVGERRALTLGLAGTALAGLGAVLVPTLAGRAAFLFLGGMAAASTNAASGRVVVGWFAPSRRGLAMGVRQTAQPLGVGLAALTLPRLAAHHGLGGALVLPTALAAACALACLLLVADPPRPSRDEAAASGALGNPYTGSDLLWRIHGVSVLLVVPQFTVWTFALVWLIGTRGWSAASAGALVLAAQLLGAGGRVAAGVWSDRWGSRMRPLRWIAVASAVTMAGLGVTAGAGWSVSVVLLVAATVVSVADNGLAFTAVAEIGGPYWSGRALGAQNTAQFLAASAVPPVIGALVGAVGYPVAFGLTAVLPILAVPLVPRRDLDRSPA
jgi:MFS family permease